MAGFQCDATSGASPGEQLFKKPWTFTLVMFVGEFTSILYFFYKRRMGLFALLSPPPPSAGGGLSPPPPSAGGSLSTPLPSVQPR